MEAKKEFRKGQQARLIGAQPVGTVQGHDAHGNVLLDYEPRPGTVTRGAYAPTLLEHVPQERKAASTAHVLPITSAPLSPK